MKHLESEIREFLTERGWVDPKPGDLAKSISIEAAELLMLFQWSNPTLEEVKDNPELLRKIGRSLADVIIYALNLTVLLNLDTEAMTKDKLALVRKKYPAERMNSLGAISDEEYQRIRDEFRKTQ